MNMTRQNIFRIKHDCLRNLCLGHLAFIILLAQPCFAAEDPSQPAVRRPDPRTGTLYAVEPGEIIPGKIYSHFSQLRGRYVWAFAEEDRSFSYVLGPGSTELPSNFDVTTSPNETKKVLEAEAGTWAKQSALEGKQVMVRLGANEKWQVVRARSIRSHYDLDSSRRWEWHGQRRVAVGHTNGYSWRYDGNGYVPANSWLQSQYGGQGHCRSVDCSWLSCSSVSCGYVSVP